MSTTTRTQAHSERPVFNIQKQQGEQPEGGYESSGTEVSEVAAAVSV